MGIIPSIWLTGLLLIAIIAILAWISYKFGTYK